MSEPAFTVVMPAFNAAATLDDSIDSVLRQTFDNLELIVVDDCSSDGTADIIKSHMARDARVRGVFLATNAGVAAARNAAIQAANGRFIAFLDADDLWLPEKLERQYQAFTAGADVVFTDYARFTSDGREKTITVPSKLSFARLLNGNCIGNLTGAYDCRKLGKFFQEPIGHEDYFMWLQILRAGAVARGLNQVLARYRVSDSSLSARKLNAAAWTWTIYREKLGYGFLTAAYFFGAYVLRAVLKRV